jgi:hypothetical protein
MAHQTARGQAAVGSQPEGSRPSFESKDPWIKVEWRRGCLVNWKNLHPPSELLLRKFVRHEPEPTNDSWSRKFVDKAGWGGLSGELKNLREDLRSRCAGIGNTKKMSDQTEDELGSDKMR